MFRRARGQLLSRSRGLLREGSRFLPLLFERLCSVCGFHLLELPRFLARLAQLRRLHLVFAPRHREFARQGSTACALLVERLTMLRRAGGQLLPRCSAILTLLSEQLRGIRSLRLQLSI